MARGTSASAKSSKLEPMAAMASAFGIKSRGPGPFSLFYDARSTKNRCLDGLRGSGDGDLDAGTVNFHGQQLAARLGYGLFHALPLVWLDQQHHAAAATRAADLSGKGAFPARSFDDAVDGSGGNRRQVPFAEVPLLAH